MTNKFLVLRDQEQGDDETEVVAVLNVDRMFDISAAFRTFNNIYQNDALASLKQFKKDCRDDPEKSFCYNAKGQLSEVEIVNRVNKILAERKANGITSASYNNRYTNREFANWLCLKYPDTVTEIDFELWDVGDYN